MIIVFWLTTLMAIIISCFYIFKRKDYFSILTYNLLGIYLPLLVSFFNWSTFSVSKNGNLFCYVFLCLNIACILYCFLPYYKLNGLEDIKIYRRKHVIPIVFINAVYIACVLIENIYLSGMLFPGLAGIDVHTGRMPGIYFLTTATYIVVVTDLLEFIASGKIRCLVYAAISFLTNIISKSSRVDAGIATIQISSLLLFIFLSKGRKKKVSIKRIVIICVLVIFLMLLINEGIAIGNNRMNSNGKYNTVYSDGIGYSGPEMDNELLAYYYGYFPMSFDNLAYNLKTVSPDFNGIGLNSFRCLYFGILQFDNLFGLDGSTAVKNKIIRCRAAAVPTIFWDFYYDYDVLVFIPIAITFLIAFSLRRKLARERTVISMIVYFYWVPMWMFGSFDNRSYDYQTIWHILILYLFFKRRYLLETSINPLELTKKRRIHFRIGRIKLW